MRYYGTITGLSVGGAAPPPAVIPGGDDRDDEMVPGGIRGLGLLCVVGVVLVVGLVYLVTKALGKRGR